MSEAAETCDPGAWVGKKQLADELGWSRGRLDRRLEEDATFPILTRGDQAGGWSFDLAAVLKHLQADLERDTASRTEMTARQRRDMAQAQLHEDKLRRQRGELVEAGDLKQALSETVTRVGVALNTLADVLVRRLNLPETALPIVRQEVDAIRRQLVTGLRDLLDPSDPA